MNRLIVERLSDRQSWLNLTEFLNDFFSKWLIHRGFLIDELIDLLIGCMNHWMIDWLIDWLIGWLVDCLVHGFIERLTE